MEIRFFLPMAKVPTVTHQQKKVHVVNGKPIYYEPPELKAARAKLTGMLAEHKPSKPFDVGVRLLVKWCFPITGKHQNGEYKTTKPDTDNLQKLLKDVMTVCGYWADDALVASEICEKLYSDIPGIFIMIDELRKEQKNVN